MSGDAERYVGGALCIFRLAPQDYHRFHSPVDGTIGQMTYISGEYYTVNVSVFFPELSVHDTERVPNSPRRSAPRWTYTVRTRERLCLSTARNSAVSWPFASVP